MAKGRAEGEKAKGDSKGRQEFVVRGDQAAARGRGSRYSADDDDYCAGGGLKAPTSIPGLENHYSDAQRRLLRGN